MNWIAVAGPYRSGGADAEQQAANLKAMNEVALHLFDKGWVPVIGVNMALPLIAVAGESRYGEIMQPLSNALVSRCDAILRIGGPSVGADAEVALLEQKGAPVYHRLEDVPPAAP
ncbi:MAG: hypothetical protein AAF367_15615 [Pseudomonadota bacterium]